jgi:phosphoglucomutase
METNPLAGKPATESILIDVSKLRGDYYSQRPDAHVARQRVAFGTSGHRGTSFDRAFNEWHILAITQAICFYRQERAISGPLFIGIDTHALSQPAFETALEVLAANGVEVMVAEGTEYTPTPAVSRAILCYNRGRAAGVADGIVITPSHNPPEDGGFKYNPPHGGPAESEITKWIETRANQFLESGLSGVKRLPFEQALRAPTTHRFDYLRAYVEDLESVLDMESIRGSGLRLGVDPLGGAGVHYWPRIAERYRLDLTVLSTAVDPTFQFMTLDWDGRIRMDPSSPYAMRRLIGLKDRFDVAFACDTDHDRHGVVARSAGLLPANHYLSVCIHYLYANRPDWPQNAAVGKTVVSSSMIDRVTAALGRQLYEVPVGFKWFVEGLSAGTLGFVGEESAGSSFLRRNGTPWSTDKDGIIAALLAAEITARTGRDPGEIYQDLTRRHGAPAYERIDAPATAEQKAALERLSSASIRTSELAGGKIQQILTRAPANNRAIGGVKIVTADGWFAARPSGTEEIYKIYAESFRGPEHLRQIQEEAQAIIQQAFEPV